MAFFAHVPCRSHGKLPHAAIWSSMMTIGVVMLVGGNAQATSQVVIAPTTDQGTTPMDQTNLANPALPRLFAPKERMDLYPFFRDSTFLAQIRTFYFDQSNFDDSFNEAWTIGGSLAYTSGYVDEHIRIGAVGYTSQALYGPENRDGTLLLKPLQQSYAVLGQLYGEIKFTDELFVAFGRKAYNTPYLNENDSRMSPNTFHGYTLYGSSGGQDGAQAWRYGGGYIDKIKDRNSDEFVSMSSDAGAKVDRGVYVAGANIKQDSFSLGAINYYSEDIINIFYTEVKYALPLTNRYVLQLSAQDSSQRSTGDDLLKGYSFSTSQTGVKADLGVGAAVLTMAYTDTANGADIQSPWSRPPGYTCVQVQNFNRAGESAFMLRASYDFSGYGFEGLSAYALKVHGSGVEAPSYNVDETDLDLQWLPKNNAQKGFSYLARYAYVSQQGGGDPQTNNLRLIVNYNF